MRTDIESNRLDRRKTRSNAFFGEITPVLSEFAVDLDLPNPQMIIADPGPFVEPLVAFMKDQIIEPNDRVWTLTRLGYFIGEWLVPRYGGCWFVREIPDTRFSAKYAVGRFTSLGNTAAMVDPFEVADAILSIPLGRRLSHHLWELELELSGFQS